MSVFKACVKKALQGENLELFRSVCDAVWSCCLSARDKDIKIISESLDVISRMVETLDEELVVPLLGIIEECASVVCFENKQMNTGSDAMLLILFMLNSSIISKLFLPIVQ
jgi:hypothetical protein